MDLHVCKREGKRTRRLHDHEKSDLVSLKTILRATIRPDVDTSMFSLVRDYYIHNDSLQKLSGVREPHRSHTRRLFCFPGHQWMIHLNRFHFNLHTTDDDDLSFAEATRSQSLLMPTICCCGSGPAETICPKKSSRDHWYCKDGDHWHCKDFAGYGR